MEREKSAERIPVALAPPDVGFLVCSFFAMLVFDGFVGYLALWQDFRTYQFLKTPGQVVSTSVQERLRTGPNRHGFDYYPQLRYSYQVAGEKYESDKRRFAERSSNTRFDAEQIAARHPVGSEIAVYYNPTLPSEAVLVRGIDGDDFFWFLFLLPLNLGWGILLGLRVCPTWTNALLESLVNLVWPPIRKQFWPKA